MKNLLKLLIVGLLCLIPSIGWSALPATGVIEIRYSATAGNVNGCGFNAARSGTDYTLQDAAQLTNTDGSGTGTTDFTSLGSTFTDAMKGNYLHITASTGLTIGWYEIVSVTSATVVVLDRTPGTGTATTFYVGGACSLNSTLDDDLFEIGIAGNVYYIKYNASSYTLGEAVTIAATGGAQNPIKIIGYNSTRTDAPTGATMPTINSAANGLSTTANWELYNFIITGTASTVLTTGTDAKIINVKAINTNTIAARTALSLGGDAIAIGVEAISYRGNAISASGRAFIYGCYLHDSDIGYLNSSTVSSEVSNTIIAGNVTAAIRFSGVIVNGVTVSNTTLYGSENTTGIGLSITASGASNIRLINSIIYGFVTGVSHVDSSQVESYDNYNAYNNNDTDVSGWTKGANDITTAPGFTSVAQLTGTTATTSGSVLTQSGGDFSTVTDNVDFLYLVNGTGITAGKYLITSHTATTVTLDIAPGTDATADKIWQITTGHNFAVGVNMKAYGFPGAFPAGLTTGYMDIGAVQRVEPAGGTTVRR